MIFITFTDRSMNKQFLFPAELYSHLAQTSPPSTIFQTCAQVQSLLPRFCTLARSTIRLLTSLPTSSSGRRSLWTSLSITNVSYPVIQQVLFLGKNVCEWVGLTFLLWLCTTLSFAFLHPPLIPLGLPLFLMPFQDIPDVG